MYEYSKIELILILYFFRKDSSNSYKFVDKINKTNKTEMLILNYF